MLPLQGKQELSGAKFSLKEKAAAVGVEAIARGKTQLQRRERRGREELRFREVAGVAQQTEFPHCFRWKEQEVLALTERGGERE